MNGSRVFAGNFAVKKSKLLPAENFLHKKSACRHGAKTQK